MTCQREMYCSSRSWALAPILVCVFLPMVWPMHTISSLESQIAASGEAPGSTLGSPTARQQHRTHSVLTDLSAQQQRSAWPSYLGSRHATSSEWRESLKEPYRSRQQRRLHHNSRGAGSLLQQVPQRHHTQLVGAPAGGRTQSMQPARRLLKEAVAHQQSTSRTRSKRQGVQLLLRKAATAVSNSNTANPETAVGGDATVEAGSSGYVASSSYNSMDSTTDDTGTGRYSSLDGGVPNSCETGRYKYPSFQVVMEWDITHPPMYNGVQDKVSYAIAQVLQLKDDYGQLDPSRVDTYLIDVYQEAGVPGNMDLDVFVYLSGNICEVFKDTWMQSVQDDPASLFRYDSELRAALVNVTAVFRDPGKDEKQMILGSTNMVVSVNVGSQADNSTGSSSTTGLYDWFLTTSSPSPGSLDGMLIMGITIGSLLILLIMVVLVQRWAQRHFRRRAEMQFTAAALAAATAAPQQAELDDIQQNRNGPLASDAHAAS